MPKPFTKAEQKVLLLDACTQICDLHNIEFFLKEHKGFFHEDGTFEEHHDYVMYHNLTETKICPVYGKEVIRLFPLVWKDKEGWQSRGVQSETPFRTAKSSSSVYCVKEVECFMYYMEDEYKHEIISAYSYAIDKYRKAAEATTRALYIPWYNLRYDLLHIKMLQKEAERKANRIDDMYPYLYEYLERDLTFMRTFHNMQDMLEDEKREFWRIFDCYLEENRICDSRSDYWDRHDTMESILED